MKLNKHGIKMTNLKKISGETFNSQNGYTQISYDRSTGELIACWHYGTSQTSWSEYRDPDIIHICDTESHMTMQELANAVWDRLSEIEYRKAYLA